MATLVRRMLPWVDIDERGVTALEYGVLAALIIGVSIVVIGQVGQQVLATFTAIQAALAAA